MRKSRLAKSWGLTDDLIVQSSSSAVFVNVTAGSGDEAAAILDRLAAFLR